ncbi:uncharacterized protein RJT21DRAFT_87032 [Scheffersomyces amazonensis]|uniref:uncharacterized protein n=1 Tax=Scheffersomyces amazonensis TaxID=1078765 RepID=UPI00315D5541
MSQTPAFSRLVTERKSRRTHKNSRDGCPNCKAKRIKCSEELPACSNCIKKNYHCGYLDFPAEKLELLRKKNEKRQREHPQFHDSQILQSPANSLGIMSNSSSNSANNNNSSLFSWSDPNGNQPPDIFASASPFNQNIDPSEFYITKDDLRVALYKDSLFKLTSSDAKWPHPLPPQQIQHLKHSVNQHNHNHEHQHHDFLSATSTSNEDDNVSSNSFENSANTFSRHIHSLDNNIEELTKDLFDSFNLNNNIVHSHPPPSAHPSHPGTPLDNAISMPFTCQKLVKTYKRKRMFIPLRSGLDQSSLSFYSLYAPVWRYEHTDIFWTAVFNQSIVLDLYFSFFMDRGLSVLIKVINTVVNAESNTTSFTVKDLNILTKKSYSYYGMLIKELRESLTNIHIEYPIKISTYSAWTTFLHLHAAVETVVLMHTGTASLLNTYVHEMSSTSEITSTLQASIQNHSNHVSFALVPDYKFDVIRELYQDLLDLRSFIIYNPDLTSKNNGVLVNTFVELETFLKDLIEVTYPKMLYINNFYKAANNIEDNSDNIIFTSPSLLFDILVHWFRIFPSEASSVGSDMSPLKKTFYLFFNAIGKALGHVFTPFRSVMLIDSVNIMYPIVDTDCMTYKIHPEHCPDLAQYNYLSRMSMKLMRIIQFFNNRVELLGYFLADKTILHSTSYLQAVGPTHDRSRYNQGDIIQIKSGKLPSLNEIMMTNFNVENAIGLWNYPLLPDLVHESFPFPDEDRGLYRKIIEKENESQHERIKNADYDSSTIIKEFNYDIGMFSFDFNITTPLRTYQRASKDSWDFNKFPIEEIKTRLKYFEDSRKQIAIAVGENRQDEK